MFILWNVDTKPLQILKAVFYTCFSVSSIKDNFSQILPKILTFLPSLMYLDLEMYWSYLLSSFVQD